MGSGRGKPRSRLSPDLAPWRGSSDFRLVWTSGTVTLLGSIFTMTAVPLQIAQLTRSPLAVGAVGAVELVPTVALGLYGGALADRVDRRRMAVLTEIGLGLLSVLLLANSLLDSPSLWPLYAAAGGAAALQGLQQPSLEAMIPRLVPDDQLVAAGALLSLRWSVGGVVAPAAAGVLVATAGVPAAYLADLATFLVSIALLLRVRPTPPAERSETTSPHDVAEGLRYIGGRPDLVGTYLVDLAATALALPTALFPFLATELHASWALGLLYSASGLGALVAAVTSGWIGRVRHHGRLVLFSGALVGLSMVGAGLSGGVWPALVFLTVGGAANWLGDTFRTAIWNQSVPDTLRGRVAGVELLVGSAGPALGDIRAGGLAARHGIRLTLWTGGLACVTTTGVLGTALPALWRYRQRAVPPSAPPATSADHTDHTEPVLLRHTERPAGLSDERGEPRAVEHGTD